MGDVGRQLWIEDLPEGHPAAREIAPLPDDRRLTFRFVVNQRHIMNRMLITGDIDQLNVSHHLVLGCEATRYPLIEMHPYRPDFNVEDDWQYNTTVRKLFHGASMPWMRQILSARRLIRGIRSKDGKCGVFGTEFMSTALCYAHPYMHCKFVFEMECCKSKSCKDAKGVFIMKEYWVCLKALWLVWMHTTRDQWEDDVSKGRLLMPEVCPIPDQECFKGWEPPPADLRERYILPPED